MKNTNQRVRSASIAKEPPPLREEVEWALKRIPSSKSPGIDGILIWKATGESGIQMMWQLCNRIWVSEEWPSDWCRGVFISIPKSGNLKERSNHRTINLIVHASKILLKIIVNEKKKYEDEIGMEQAGYK
ncbi:uncharacterized protein LOC125047918 [Penaeus chinensis]|uniref:uncharacterized protein LOC125047918 n=1 Tax=Penaeus chinensis TaxID=139456 RepID=UPI001FB5ABF0|nr:uncharacterized protein LOC125047918 [Penaeus chinensis]